MTLDPSGLEPYLSANNFALVRRRVRLGGGSAPRAARAARGLAARRPSVRRRERRPGLEDAVPERLDEFLDWLLALAPADLETELARCRRATPPA